MYLKFSTKLTKGCSKKHYIDKTSYFGIFIKAVSENATPFI